MNDKREHHWSFDYNYGAQTPQFTQELIGTLNGCYTDIGARAKRAEEAITHIYNILPNYWRGYAGGGAEASLSIGTVIVERSKQDGVWHYVVEYENTTSGEYLRMRFRCCDEPYRPLTERWRVDARNSGDDKPKAVEDFLPPGPDAAQFGLAQLFDRHNDPGETKNLIGNPTYDEVVKTCRDKLLAQETELHRQEMVHPSPKRIISNWGDRLRSHWHLMDRI